MPPNSLDTRIEEAGAALKASEGRQHSKGGRAPKTIGKVVREGDSIYETLSSNEDVVAAFSVVKDKVSSFAENCQSLVDALDVVANMHPFIAVAVGVFKVVLKLELARSGNEEKIVALHVTMSDMMEILLMLKNVKDPKDVHTVQDRLKARMSEVADSIKACARLCDSYQTRHVAIKFFTSLQWQKKFTDAATQFAEHKNAIQFELQLYTSVAITTANVTLSGVSEGIDGLNDSIGKLMAIIFTRMLSAEEREVASLVSLRGGADKARQNDKLLEDVLAIVKSKEAKGSRRQGDLTETSKTKKMTVAELKQEMKKDVEQVVADNKSFEQKFEVVEIHLREIKESIKHESDRVINTLLNGPHGPHERIIDPDMCHVWKEMEWKGSVKAKHLVMALQDHFTDYSRATLAAIRDITSHRGDTSDSQMVDKITGLANRPDPIVRDSDKWALEYIAVHRVQPLIEALDADASSFVSVNEVNAFTAARPPDWSLPHWIAYWTYGFEMTVQWYFRRIRKVFAEIYSAGNVALPSNLRTISRFFTSWEVRITEVMLSGLRDVELWDNVNWEDHPVFLKFHDYVKENEARMERSLRTVKYYLDAANTLVIVAGEGRPEKFVLPLIFLLLRRALCVIKEAGYVTLHDRELEVIMDSLSVLLNAVFDRVRTLQAMYKLQNLNEKDQLSKFFYGLYRYTVEEAEAGPFWKRTIWGDLYWEAEEDRTFQGLNDVGPVPLFYGPRLEGIYLLTNQALADEVSAPPSEALHSPVGHWSGRFTYGGVNWGDASFCLTISAHAEDGSIRGSGVDPLGFFTVAGTQKGDQLKFTKEYATPRQGHGVAWLYQGTINEGQDKITGAVTWVRFPDDTDDREGASVPRNVSEGSEDDMPPNGGSNLPLTDINETPQIEVNASLEVDDKSLTIAVNGPTPLFGVLAVVDNPLLANPDEATCSGEPVSGSSLAATLPNSGEFFLERHPLDYLLVCPSDGEFAQDRPRAFWKLALNYALRVVRSRTVSWRAPSERRRVFEFVRANQQCLVNSEMAREWVNLVRGIRPEDTQLQECIQAMKFRRECIVTFDCDSCMGSPWREETPSSRTRYTCVDCSLNQLEVSGSIDLCASCFFEDKAVTRDNIVHSPTHNLIQFRTARLKVYHHTLLSAGKITVQQASTLTESEDGASTPPPEKERAVCLECKKHIKGPPYWVCVECLAWTWELVFICCECNKRAEEEKPWLTQLVANTDHRNIHDWSHILVSVPDPDVGNKSDERSKLSTEERLIRLEKNLDSRLEALEKLLDQLLNTSVTGSVQQGA